MDASKYYGIFIPDDDSNESNKTDKLHVYTTYEEAYKIIKTFKNARFKCFSTHAEAAYFALNGSSSGPGNPNVASESTPFKSLKRQDIYIFRRCIENKNLSAVQALVCENPRNLIGIGDTPTIMQEGPRYNALHIAAMYNSFQIAEFILKTISSKSFTEFLYGGAGDSSYLVRPEVMVDMYLNTPDKVLNETPLHFAAKFGSLEVIQVFIQYPQLQVSVKNKYGQTPKDITCNSFRAKELQRNTDAKIITQCKKEIHKLLDEPFYVPVWRSNDDVVQPIIGKPFSPKSPPVYPMVSSPLSPTMEIKAVAGPMTFDEANNFHKTWKSPVKANTFGTPYLTRGVLLRNPFRGEKGLEKVGRTLAKEFHVSWKEYWPFLDKFIDLASEEGLKLLEEYLHDTILESTYETRNSSFVINSPMSDLCKAFAEFSINSPQVSFNQKNGPNDCKTLSPYLCVDNLCSTFGKTVMNIFRENFKNKKSVEQNVAILIKKVRNLCSAINVCNQDSAFNEFPFDRIHARISYWITTNIGQIDDQWLRYVTSVFQIIHISEKSEMISCISVSPSETKIELDGIVRTLKCINNNIIKLLQTEVISESGLELNTEWSSIESCSCFNNNNSNNNMYYESGGISSKRILKCRRDFRRSLVFNEDFEDNDRPCDTENVFEVTSHKNCDNFVKCLSDFNICSDDSSDEEYYTPPDSSLNSEDEMGSPDEGPDIFIYDNKGTSMDNMVLEAISDVQIDPIRFPSIYRWKHSVLLHKNVHRFSWPSPNAKQLKLRKFVTDNI